MDGTWAMASWGERYFNRALWDKRLTRRKEKHWTPVFSVHHCTSSAWPKVSEQNTKMQMPKEHTIKGNTVLTMVGLTNFTLNAMGKHWRLCGREVTWCICVVESPNFWTVWNLDGVGVDDRMSQKETLGTVVFQMATAKPWLLPSGRKLIVRHMKYAWSGNFSTRGVHMVLCLSSYSMWVAMVVPVSTFLTVRWAYSKLPWLCFSE